MIDSDLSPVNAQSSTAIKFLTYRNPILGFTLQHPSNWHVDEDRSSDGLVQFFTPHSNLAIFVVSVHNVTRYLDTDTLTLKDTTARQYALDRLNTLSKTSTADFKQIRSNEFNITGSVGWKIEYSVNFLSTGELPKELARGLPKGPVYNFEVFTVANGKIYTLKYNEKFLKVPETLPLGNKTVDSFQIIR